MKQFCHSLVFLFIASHIVQGFNITNKDVETRKKRVFALFSVVSFPNSQCILGSTANSKLVMFGTCRSQDDCSNIGGTGDGSCSAGFGVCCMVSVSACGGTVSQNVSYIQSPSFPSSFTTVTTCTYTFNVVPSSICQIRLDFDSVVTNAPSAVGVCADKITVTSPSGAPPPIVCGTLTGSHMYFEVGQTSIPSTLSVVTTAIAGAISRNWKIRTSFIECNSNYKAPTDCVQYFTGTSGSFTSYNFLTVGGQMLEKQNYFYCFRQEEGFCTMDVTSSGLQTFKLDTTITSKRTNCVNAYVQLRTNASPGGNTDLYCGGYLSPVDQSTNNGDVNVNAQPLTVFFFSNAPAAIPGFSLQYMQLAC